VDIKIKTPFERKFSHKILGGPDRIRTGDLLRDREMIGQLHYEPTNVVVRPKTLQILAVFAPYGNL
jgi:hypothetical protein